MEASFAGSPKYSFGMLSKKNVSTAGWSSLVNLRCMRPVDLCSSLCMNLFEKVSSAFVKSFVNLSGATLMMTGLSVGIALCNVPSGFMSMLWT